MVMLHDLATMIGHYFMTEVKVKVTQSCSTLCNPMVYIVHGILQASILK